MSSPAPSQQALTPEQEELLALLLEEEMAAGEKEKPEASPPTASSTLMPIQPEGDAPPLFLVGAFHFRLLAHQLGRRRPIYGLVGRNLDEAKSYMGRVEEMATGYVQDIRSVQPQGPYRLCGFCFGGLVAYEMAQQLHAHGDEVTFLAMLDTYSPTLRRFEKALPASTRQTRLEGYKERIREKGLRAVAQILRDWSLYRYHAGSHWLQRSVAALYVRAGRPIPIRIRGGYTRQRDSEASRHYNPKPYAGPVTVLASADVPQIQDGARYLDLDPTLGWHELVSGPITTAIVDGGHGDFLRSPHVERFAAQFERLLQDAEAVAARPSQTAIAQP